MTRRSDDWERASTIGRQSPADQEDFKNEPEYWPGIKDARTRQGGRAEAWQTATAIERERSARKADSLARYYRMAADHHLAIEPSLIISRDRAKIAERIARMIREEA